MNAPPQNYQSRCFFPSSGQYHQALREGIFFRNASTSNEIVTPFGRRMVCDTRSIDNSGFSMSAASASNASRSSAETTMGKIPFFKTVIIEKYRQSLLKSHTECQNPAMPKGHVHGLTHSQNYRQQQEFQPAGKALCSAQNPAVRCRHGHNAFHQTDFCRGLIA